MSKIVTVNNRQITLRSRQVVMVPLSPPLPNGQGIYSPDKNQLPLVINESELSAYNSKQILVAPADDISNPYLMTVYFRGLGPWYLAVA